MRVKLHACREALVEDIRLQDAAHCLNKKKGH